QGGLWKTGETSTVPAVTVALEQWDRIARLLEHKKDVELELNVANTFYDDDAMQYNTIAEIPGSDKKDELVMVGAHLDAWHAGTGATDNGAGSVVAMEAMRILKAIGVKPRRTIRIGPWTGQEQGLPASRGCRAAAASGRGKSRAASARAAPCGSTSARGPSRPTRWSGPCRASCARRRG